MGRQNEFIRRALKNRSDRNTQENLAKIKSAFFDPKSCETSPIMLFIKHVVFFISKTGKFLVKRSEEHGGDLEYSSYDDLLQACQAEKVHPADVKTALGEFLIELLEPVRQNLNTPEFKAITQAVYSPKVENFKPKTSLTTPGCLKLQIGEIKSIEKHPNADSLIVLKVDFGGEELKTLITNLNMITMEMIANVKNIFLTNLSTQKIRGVETCAMIFCFPSEKNQIP